MCKLPQEHGRICPPCGWVWGVESCSCLELELTEINPSLPPTCFPGRLDVASIQRLQSFRTVLSDRSFCPCSFWSRWGDRVLVLPAIFPAPSPRPLFLKYLRPHFYISLPKYCAEVEAAGPWEVALCPQHPSPWWMGGTYTVTRPSDPLPPPRPASCLGGSFCPSWEREGAFKPWGAVTLRHSDLVVASGCREKSSETAC